MAAFPDRIINLAIGRQNGRCGDCGDKLNDVYFEAHHLLRRADGGRDELDNCVVLCDTCHYVAHNYGHYRQALQLTPAHFRYFYG